MGESHDFITLDWVQSDVEDTLMAAQESIESYLAEPDNKAHLQTCHDRVHQVHGTLQITGLIGGMLLTEQVEALLNSMLNQTVADTDQAHAALAQALVQLPAYMTRVREDGDETPALLLPAINDLRAALGEEALSGSSFFEPDLGEPIGEASDEAVAAFEQEDAANLRKFRQIYQFALTGLLRDESPKTNYARMSNVVVRVQQLTKGTRLSPLWNITAAVIEGLLNESIQHDKALVELLRGVDKAFKLIVEKGAEALNVAAEPALLKGLLYHVAHSAATSPHIQAIRREYQLDGYFLTVNAQANTGLMAGPDKDTLNSVVTALTEELSRIKDTIDLYVRSEVKDNIDLGGLQPSLNQIASTLILLNMEAPRVAIQQQIDALTTHSNELPDDVLLEIAESLLYIEAELLSAVDSVKVGEDDQESMAAYAGSGHDAVIKESLNSLREAKEAIHQYALAPENSALLEQVPSALRAVYGGLSILGYYCAGQPGLRRCSLRRRRLAGSWPGCRTRQHGEIG